MKVAVLTMFTGLDKMNPLVSVVSEHLKMMLHAGIKTKILVSQDCPDAERWGIFADDRLGWVKITNQLDGKRMQWHDYALPKGELHGTFFAETEIVAKDFRAALSDVDICMMYDIHFQGRYLVHNVALRRAQENLAKVKFIAFTQSLPMNRPPLLKYPFSCRYTPMPNTVYVYPWDSGIPALAKQYGVSENRCRAVHNNIGLPDYMSEDVRQLCETTDLLNPEILIVYPGCITPVKKIEEVAALAGALRQKAGLTAKVVFCDSPDIDANPEKYKPDIRTAGRLFGLEDENMVFTSDFGWPQGFPKVGFLELLTISNLFICPFFTETLGLTVLEAASRGNLLILNEDVSALKELGKRLGAYMLRCDAPNNEFETKENNLPSRFAYLEEHATGIIGRMRDDAVLRAKTTARCEFNPDWIWRHQLCPLLEE
ncbi:MAG TPA: glycosyltransferase [Oscillospiraceae bacterium]|nr:glycosyltransferase [Oscillospiraceae bacterium]HPS34750.1 glycosyltransferase [Oscillospiraceae bacterium]